MRPALVTTAGVHLLGTEVRLRLVGPFELHHTNGVLSATEVGSRKARRLLSLLAVEQGRMVGLGRIVEVLWGDAPPRLPAENVATLVSRLRTTLGCAAVTGGRAGYRLGRAVGVDLHEGAALTTAARRILASGDPTAALAAAGSALDLLDGELLEDEADATWVTCARGVHTELLRRARIAVAEAAYQAGDLTTAAATAEAAADADGLDEAAYRTVMRAYAAAGEPARALAAFERLRRTLAIELGVHPARPTRELHVAILQERFVSAAS